jgi:hypothetical protein
MPSASKFTRHIEVKSFYKLIYVYFALHGEKKNQFQDFYEVTHFQAPEFEKVEIEMSSVCTYKVRQANFLF